MRLVGAISTAVLSLSLGIGIPAYAQQDQHEQQDENKDKAAQEKEKKVPPEKTAKPEEKNAQEEHAQQSKPEQNEQHASRGRIPADRFKANFGREHSFRVSQADYGNRRFQCGGYWFGFVSVWPSNWLYTQDVYVVEINGVYYLCNASYPGVYYLCNASYPGVNLTLSVTL
jgi:hypothetical protein